MIYTHIIDAELENVLKSFRQATAVAQHVRGAFAVDGVIEDQRVERLRRETSAGVIPPGTA